MKPMNEHTFIQEQAEHYANVSIIDPSIVASVHLENEDDMLFWDAQLQRVKPGRYNYIFHSKHDPEAESESSGCEQCLKYKGYLSSRFFICIDSDLRHLRGEEGLTTDNYIAQTYTYSWENHCCEKSYLDRFACHYEQDFSFPSFLNKLSNEVYLPLINLLSAELDDQLRDFPKFRRCIPGQAKRTELPDNGEELIKKIRCNLLQFKDTSDAQKGELLKETYKERGLEAENAYLHIHGHTMYNLITSIGKLLYKGTERDFPNDIKESICHLSGYKEIDNVINDLRKILSTE